MKQSILLLILSSLCLNAIDFKETKRIEAFELETYRYGSIHNDNNKTTIKYKDGKTIIKVNNTLTVYNSKHKLLTTINLLKKPSIALYFKLTKALFSKNFNSLKKNFTIKKQNVKYTFLPKGDTAHVVNSIELVVNKNGSVRYFFIDFKNRDSIKIETI